MEIHFVSFQDFVYNNLFVLVHIVPSYCKALNNDGNKCLLLDVNLKTRFLDAQKIQKAQKKINVVKKKQFISDLV